MVQEGYYEHGGNIYAAARLMGEKVGQFLDFSANINPFGLPVSVRKSLLDGIDDVVNYPDAEAWALKEAISRHYGVPIEEITVGNGAVELLYVLCHAVRPQRVMVAAPTFSEYERAARAAKADVCYLPLSPDEGFALPVANIISALPFIDMVFVGNPNNPTGTVLTAAELEPLLYAAAKKNVAVVVDESFIDFLFNDDIYTCRTLLARYPNLVVLHSLTKFYAIPGLRLGFALTAPRLAAIMHASKDPWNVNALAQAAGVAALQDKEYRSKSRQYVAAAKKALYDGLAQIPGLKPFPPAVNFILVDVAGTGMTAAALRKAMMEEHVLIRDCSNYPGLTPYYVRVAVRKEEENNQLLRILATVCGGRND
ncbi:putative L-threonine-O-3-phosphate decarboxylase [Thermosinus carboxydivorans Nor1]|uniref:threonine-phosphate decarboxylase n=1 Tax=Thermosinus carboxydivorans Nor1 TaxID=401526 RepID=A1HPV9_9FIRM|nr:threonine-phosphate decarboxylase CobD [Thermosinus carboxydivorans]EAX47811.1 putative L-threonine-O-3-phosphate decarboxylase [Thermosinus carboxydivorans Nor1]